MKVQVEVGTVYEVRNLRFVAGDGAVTTAAFGDNDELVITLPATEADLTQAESDIEALQAAALSAEEVTGFRDDPESALANLLTVLDGLGIITDSTEETDA